MSEGALRLTPIRREPLGTLALSVQPWYVAEEPLSLVSFSVWSRWRQDSRAPLRPN